MNFDFLGVDLLWGMAFLFFGWVVFMLNYHRLALISFLVSILLFTIYVGVKL
jgi:hypothetical protein